MECVSNNASMCVHVSAMSSVITLTNMLSLSWCKFFVCNATGVHEIGCVSTLYT